MIDVVAIKADTRAEALEYFKDKIKSNVKFKIEPITVKSETNILDSQRFWSMSFLGARLETTDRPNDGLYYQKNIKPTYYVCCESEYTLINIDYESIEDAKDDMEKVRNMIYENLLHLSEDEVYID